MIPGGPRSGACAAAVCLACLVAAPLSAASVKIWVCDSASEFSAGEARGVSVSADGTLFAGRSLEKVEGVSEAVLFAAAEGKNGELFVGTGDSGRILRIGSGGKLDVYASLSEQEVTALRTGPDGALYAGASPGGRVYRIDKGKASLYYETGAQYVWALAFSGPVLYVGTGLPGEIHRVTPGAKSGEPPKGERVHVSSDPHIRALFADAKGRLWAGTSGSGRVLRLEPGGHVATIYDSGKPEVTSIVADRSGRIWAAAGSAEVPGSGGEPISAPTSPSPARSSRPAGSGDDDDHGRPEVTVSVSAPRIAPSRGSQHGGYSSEVLVFDEGEPARTVWTGTEEVVFDLATDPDGRGVLAGTGPRGKLYAITPESSSLVRTFDEKQVTFLAGGDVGTNASSAVYRAGGASSAGEYVSPVKDTGRTSRFGAFRWEGDTPSGTDVVFSFRSGESSMPDSTWSDWSPWQGDSRTLKVDAPDGRFLQWRARLRSDGDHIARVRRTEVAYRNRNGTPVIDALSALEPAEVLTRSGSSSTNVFESTAQDEKGIFTSLEEPKSEGSPRRLLRKGFRTLQWKATDPDGDGSRLRALVPAGERLEVAAAAGGRARVFLLLRLELAARRRVRLPRDRLGRRRESRERARPRRATPLRSGSTTRRRCFARRRAGRASSRSRRRTPRLRSSKRTTASTRSDGSGSSRRTDCRIRRERRIASFFRPTPTARTCSSESRTPRATSRRCRSRRRSSRAGQVARKPSIISAA